MSRMTFAWTEVAKEVLQRDYPEANIVVASPDEVIAEIRDGEAIVVVSTTGSRRHFHLKTIETYEVIDGTLAVDVKGSGYVLRKGETLTMLPPAVHKAAGDGAPATFKATSEPSWIYADHFEV